jgi:PH (Pleckstrin Homology) domain-containing protein/putative oligomerization/nucleic acid binding protein
VPRYADRLLSQGEEVVLRTRQHWLALLLEARYAVLLFVAGLVLLFLSQSLSGTIHDIAGYLTIGAIVISLLWLAKTYMTWYSEDYLVTNRRVLKVEGIINKRSADSSLEKINDAVLEQNLFGRMFNYGDLDILTAADVAVDRYRMLNRAAEFKREMLNQKHDLEGEYSRPLPSPPLRSAPATPAPPPPAAAPAPARREMTADEVTRALGGLADLRDRGAISPQEYEAKKADLLGRL